MKSIRSGCFAISAVALIAGATCMRAGDASGGRALALRADVNMILVPVTVVDRGGVPVNGLDRNNFTILDNKTSQKIVSFSSEDAPCSVGLVLDLSGSMRNALGPAKEALTKFLGTANPEDEFILLGVTTRPQIYPVGSFEEVGDFTSDTSVIQSSIQLAPLGGSTALIDTVYAALGKMRKAHNPRRALVIVSDGMDNHSRYTKQDLIRVAAEADVQIYTIAIDNAPHTGKPIQQHEAHRGMEYLQELAERTGGVYFVAENRQQISRIVERIGSAIRSEYVIGYQPGTFDNSGKWHRIQVKLDREKLQVYARSGYYAR